MDTTSELVKKKSEVKHTYNRRTCKLEVHKAERQGGGVGGDSQSTRDTDGALQCSGHTTYMSVRLTPGLDFCERRHGACSGQGFLLPIANRNQCITSMTCSLSLLQHRSTARTARVLFKRSHPSKVTSTIVYQTKKSFANID